MNPFELLSELEGYLSHSRECGCDCCEGLAALRRAFTELQAERLPPFHRARAEWDEEDEHEMS